MSFVGLDDRDVIFSPICVNCKHADIFFERKCTAFPDGIPLDIWAGEVSHNEPVNGNHGIVFTPITREERNAREAARESMRKTIEAELDREIPGGVEKLHEFLEKANKRFAAIS